MQSQLADRIVPSTQHTHNHTHTLPRVPCEEWANRWCGHMMSAFTSCRGGMRLLSARSRPRLRFSLPPELAGVPVIEEILELDAKDGLRRRLA